MVSTDKQQGQDGKPAARMRRCYAAGDFRGAREAAWAVLHDGTATDAERAEAERLRANTEVDRKAWGIAIAAVALAAVVVVFFLL